MASRSVIYSFFFMCYFLPKLHSSFIKLEPRENRGSTKSLYASGRELKDDYEGGKYISAFELTLAAIPQSLTGWEN
jgi:hypothetical protein